MNKKLELKVSIKAYMTDFPRFPDARTFEDQIEKFKYRVGTVWYLMNRLDTDGYFLANNHIINLDLDLDEQKLYVESIDTFHQWI